MSGSDLPGRPTTGLAEGVPHPGGDLRSPTFRRLTVAWIFSNFADSTLVLILAVWVTDLTDDVVAGGLTFAMLGVPALLAPFLGALADRVSRRKLLMATYLAGALVLLPLLTVRDAQQVWIVYVVTVAYATVGYVTGAAQSGLLRDLLPDRALGPANARLSMIDQSFRVAMPFAGAGVYAAIGPFPLVGVAAGAFVASAAVLSLVRIAESVTPREARITTVELVSGFRHVFQVRPLRHLTMVSTVAFAATGLVDGAVFAILDDIGIPRTWLPPILVLQGIGGVVASLVAPRLMEAWGRPRLVAAGLLMVALGLAPLPLGTVALMVGAQLAVGLGTTAALIAYTTERTASTSAELQGRAAAASQVLLGFPHVLLAGAGALLLTILDWRTVVTVTVVVVLVCGALCLLVGRQAKGAAPTTIGASRRTSTGRRRTDRRAQPRPQVGHVPRRRSQ